MGDIVKAIEKEKEYISYRMKGEEPFHLVDAVNECGFADLTDYFEVKRKYDFKQMKFEFIEKKPSECIQEVFRMMAAKVTGVLFVDSDSTFVFNGTANYNQDYCTKENIPVFPIGTNGGTIVCTDGDFSIGICFPTSAGLNYADILKAIKDILQKHTERIVTVNGNDVLVDKMKVLGSAHYDGNDVFMFVAHLSFSDKAELISNICTTTKIGKDVGSIDFMTRTDFKQGVSEWLKLSI